MKNDCSDVIVSSLDGSKLNATNDTHPSLAATAKGNEKEAVSVMSKLVPINGNPFHSSSDLQPSIREFVENLNKT